MVNKNFEIIKKVISCIPSIHEFEICSSIYQIHSLKHDMIINNLFDCLYINMSEKLSYVVDNINYVYIFFSYKHHCLFFCGCDSNIEGTIQEIHYNNETMSIDKCTSVHCDLKQEFLFTCTCTSYMVYRIDVHNLGVKPLKDCIKIVNKFSPLLRYTLNVHLEDSFILYKVFNYYDHVKDTFVAISVFRYNKDIYAYCYINGQIKVKYVTEMNPDEFEETNIWLMGKEHIGVYYQSFSVFVNFITDECYSISNFDLVYKTTYMSTCDSVYIELFDSFYIISEKIVQHMIKNNISMEFVRFYRDIEDPLYSSIIVGNFDASVPYISDDEQFVFYIYNRQLFVQDIAKNEMFTPTYKLPTNFSYQVMKYDNINCRLLLGTTSGKVVEYNLK